MNLKFKEKSTLTGLKQTALPEDSQNSLEAEIHQFMGKDTKRKFKNWRLRILISAILGYASYYVVRQNFTIAMPVLINEFGYTKTQLGWAMFLFNIIYGFGKLFNGYLSDRSNARYFMAFGLGACGVISIFLGLSKGLMSFILLYAFIGWFQSMGFPPVARMLTHWFTPKELGTKWAIASAAHQIGGATINASAAFLILWMGWQGAFFVPGFFAIGMALLLVYLLRDRPEEVDLPAPEAYKGEKVPEIDPTRVSMREVYEIVLTNRSLWFVCLSNMCLYIVRMGVITWAPTFLWEMKGIALQKAGFQVAIYELAGIAGGIFAGWLSDRLFKGRRGPVGFLYMLLLAGSLVYFWKIEPGHDVANAIAMTMVGFLVYGPQVLVGVASADLGSKRAVGVANGFAGTFAYVGVGLSSLIIGWVSDHWGWDIGFAMFITAALLGAGFFALNWEKSAQQ